MMTEPNANLLSSSPQHDELYELVRSLLMSVRPAAFLCIREHNRQRLLLLHKRVSAMSKQVKVDFSLDETAAAKLVLGLGDASVPAVSLFTMPMLDITSKNLVRVGSDQHAATICLCTMIMTALQEAGGSHYYAVAH
jgi:hypothetical protein